MKHTDERGKSSPARSKIAKNMRPKVKHEMHKFKEHTLHSGSKKGPVVKERKQAIAIALNVARKGKRK